MMRCWTLFHRQIIHLSLQIKIQESLDPLAFQELGTQGNPNENYA